MTGGRYVLPHETACGRRSLFWSAGAKYLLLQSGKVENYLSNLLRCYWQDVPLFHHGILLLPSEVSRSQFRAISIYIIINRKNDS